MREPRVGLTAPGPFLASQNPARWGVTGLTETFPNREAALRAFRKLPPFGMGEYISPGLAAALNRREEAKRGLSDLLAPKVRRA